MKNRCRIGNSINNPTDTHHTTTKLQETYGFNKWIIDGQNLNNIRSEDKILLMDEEKETAGCSNRCRNRERKEKCKRQL